MALSRWAKYTHTHTRRERNTTTVLACYKELLERFSEFVSHKSLSICRANRMLLEYAAVNHRFLHRTSVTCIWEEFSLFFFFLFVYWLEVNADGSARGKKKNVPQSSISLKSHHLFLTRTGAPKFLVPLCVHLSSHWEIEPFQREPPPLFPSPARHGDECREDISVFPPLIRLRLQSIFTVWLRTD